jgi:hypothetical protein
MRKGLILAAALALTPVARADEAAVKVVKAAVEAHGGEKALTAVKAGDMSLNATLDVMGTDVEFAGEAAYSFPDKMAVTLSGEIMGQKIAIVQVVNGDKVKMTANGTAIPVDDKLKAELKQSAVEQHVGLIVPLLDKKYTLAVEADEKVGAAEATVVRASAKGLRDTKFFFDKKTHLLVRMQRQGLDQSGQEVDTVSDLSDYKKVDGVQTPTSVKVLHDGKAFMTMKLSDVRYFDKPTEEKRFATDDK